MLLHLLSPKKLRGAVDLMVCRRADVPGSGVKLPLNIFHPCGCIRNILLLSVLLHVLWADNSCVDLRML